MKNIEIERLRGIAILLVMLSHFYLLVSIFPAYLKYTWIGVDLFFVISGFVVTNSFLKILPDLSNLSLSQKFNSAIPSLKAFYIKRIYRILPVALTWLIIHLVLTGIFQIFRDETFGSLKKILLEDLYIVLLVFNYLRDNTAIQGQFWSLCVEEHFYLLIPFFFVIFDTSRKRILFSVISVLLVMFVLRPYITAGGLTDLESFNFFTSHRRFDSLFIGVILSLMQRINYFKMHQSRALSFRFINNSIVRNIITATLLYVLIISPYMVGEQHRHGMGFTLYAVVGAMLVFLASLQNHFILEIKCLGKLLELIGSRSYGIYLAHVPIVRLFNWFVEYDRGIPIANITVSLTTGIILFAVFVLINLLISNLIYNQIERVFINKGKLISAKYIASNNEC